MNNQSNQVIFKTILLTLIIGVLLFGKELPGQQRNQMKLVGKWQFAPDTADSGIKEKWYGKKLNDRIMLPGTTDLNKKGAKNFDRSASHLSRVYKYEGAAWYRREVNIPESWSGRHIKLFMERTKPSTVWVDNSQAGSSLLLESPQEYDLSALLKPGKHTITVRVDNNLKLTPYGNVHIYSDDTQTNWNGIIGKLYLEASERNHIRAMKVFPDITAQCVRVSIQYDNPLHFEKADIELRITKELNGKVLKLKPVNYSALCSQVIELEYFLGKQTDLWDEYHTPLYKLTASVSINGKYKDKMTVPFGMRKFEAKGTNFMINGRTLFLRGKHDACVFPLTGFPPMDTEGWLKVFRVAKSYGINHYRFHSWCPPEAAFDAADKTGIYLQPELPFWGGLDSDTTAKNLTDEGISLLKCYANHPSFVLFSPGNEIWGGHERVERIIEELKKYDSRPLYAQGSNNNIGYAAPLPYEQFHIAARTPYAYDTTLTHLRLTHAFADSREGGILNSRPPSANVNYDYPVSQIRIPVVSHETGQYQIFPDYREIEKYTGVLKARNLEEFRDRLKEAGMLDQNLSFAKSSGALAALCYRAEIEAALKTRGLGGFQLLDLQDYPGQGTALVGILDAFMESKNIISRSEWSQFCSDVVPLLSFEKFTWTSAEKFSAEVLTANYSNRNIKGNIRWYLKENSGRIIEKGVIKKSDIACGGLNSHGEIGFSFDGLKLPAKLTLTVLIENTGYKNSYSIWIYPENKSNLESGNILTADHLNNEVFEKLNSGGKVLLMPAADSVKYNTVKGMFPPDFWNFGMFKGISDWAKKPVSPGTLGLLTDPGHPVFRSFPTDSHTNWQWWQIIKNSNPLILNMTSKNYRPVVQVIDNIERNYKLGLLFEFKAGRGKLFICMSRLNEIKDDPAAVQLYSSIINYMNSADFNPSYEADEEILHNLLK